ncbi:MAG TPA: DUF2190 domain-containing protein [Acidiferrobacteraceae bacterium]|nr:DUF2190 domain-containing protein [Acidiferrobacteraceae bacterium]
MNNPLLIKNFVAETAVAAYRIIKFGSDDDSVVQAAANTDAMFGVCGSLAAVAAERVDINMAGPVDVEYGGNVTRGNKLTSDANGKAIAVTRHTHTENTAGAYTQNATTGAGSGINIIGTAMVSGVDGDIGSALINPSYA